MTALNWEHRCHEIPRNGVVRQIVVDPGTRAALARELDVLGVERLSVDYTVRPLRSGRFRLSGQVAADVWLECGVSLDPTVQEIREDFDVEFLPPAEGQADDDLGFDPLADTDLETIHNGRIDAGRLVTEVVASAIDPFARDADAELEAAEAKPNEAAEDHPFAALAALKSGRGEGTDAED
jgi:uncharacterized metal-binding protein YceD (DUF177 family)